MTSPGIKMLQAKAAIPYDVALKIRALLDEAAAEYGESEWIDDDVETKVIDLVTGDDE